MYFVQHPARACILRVCCVVVALLAMLLAYNNPRRWRCRAWCVWCGGAPRRRRPLTFLRHASAALPTHVHVRHALESACRRRAWQPARMAVSAPLHVCWGARRRGARPPRRGVTRLVWWWRTRDCAVAGQLVALPRAQWELSAAVPVQPRACRGSRACCASAVGSCPVALTDWRVDCSPLGLHAPSCSHDPIYQRTRACGPPCLLLVGRTALGCVSPHGVPARLAAAAVCVLYDVPYPSPHDTHWVCG